MPTSITPQLISDCRAGHRRAQRKLYDLTLPYLSAVGRRYLHHKDLLEDTLQLVYLNLFTRLEQYDAERGTLLAWASRITVHECLKQNERSGREPTSQLSDQVVQEPGRPAAVLAELSHRELVEWLRSMPPSLYEVFNLCAIDGFSHAEVAELLDIKPDLSRQRLARARAWIRRSLPAEMRPETLTRAGGWDAALAALVYLLQMMHP